jgi:tetratricopeptide (TPR) repeat protein
VFRATGCGSGRCSTALGQLADALTSYQRSATLHRRLGNRSREALAWQGAGEVHQRLARSEEAADFHRRAVAVHRELGDSWNEAIALVGLATALRSEPHWAEALRLLAEYDDSRAVATRARIESLIDAPRYG